MRKSIYILLLLMFFTSTCLAADVAQENKDIKQIISDYKELNYRFDAGISYIKFRDTYSDVYVKVRRFQDTYPISFSYELNSINMVYNDISYLWKDVIDYNLIVVPNQTSRELKKKYPNLERRVNKGIFGGWNPFSTISALDSIAKEKVNQFETQINNKNDKTTYGFFYSSILINKDLLPDPFIYVSSISPGSIAEKSGLKAGDKITKINDAPMSQFTYNSLDKFLTANSKITLLVVRDTAEITITLEKYFF